jgi:glycine/D-amino acid oxidase-like deaminating enzyme
VRDNPAVVITRPYWLEEPAAPLPASVRIGSPDVIVVGGGVTGCACALALADAGLKVRLHEARELAGGASGRNAGFALRGGAMSYVDAREAIGAERARLLWEVSERALVRIARLAGDAFRRTGSLRVAADEAEGTALARELEALREDGFEAALLERLPSPLERRFGPALLHPTDGTLQPARWVRGLAARAAAAGAELLEGSRVAVDVLDAGHVVVAADGLTETVLPELAGIVRPVRGQMLATAPLRERRFERPHYARHGFDYWVQEAETGRLLVGGKRDASLATESSSAEETTPLVQALLDAFATELAGERVTVTHRWAGIWGETPDRLPFAGPVPGRDGVWAAGGYSGHGNVLGFACGELVARAILGKPAPELALFDPARLSGLARPEGAGPRLS